MQNEIQTVMHIVTHKLPLANIPCLMIGGHAVNHYGVTRATQDIDFMIAAPHGDAVRQIMKHEGYTNIAEYDTVTFYNKPNSPFRVDFLKVSTDTLDKLSANAVKVTYATEHQVFVPHLHDLIAMKLFALASGGPGRAEKDFSDIVHLVIENNVDIDQDLQTLSQTYATEEIFNKLKSRIKELRHA